MFLRCLSLLSFAAVMSGCSSPEQPTEADAPASAQAVSDQAKDHALTAKDALFAKLSGRLTEVMQAEGPVRAIEVCSKEANQIARAVGAEQGVMIGRTSLKLRNSSNQPPEWAKQLINEKPHEPQFTNIDDLTVGALLPIKLQAKCLMCHGPVDSLVPGVPEQLAKLYPDDQATGFSEGDLRGWFWVEVPAKATESSGESNEG